MKHIFLTKTDVAVNSSYVAHWYCTKQSFSWDIVHLLQIATLRYKHMKHLHKKKIYSMNSSGERNKSTKNKRTFSML